MMMKHVIPKNSYWRTPAGSIIRVSEVHQSTLEATARVVAILCDDEETWKQAPFTQKPHLYPLRDFMRYIPLTLADLPKCIEVNA